MGIGGKSEGKSKGNDQSLRPSGFAPAFGRAVAPSAGHFIGTRERVPFPGTPFSASEVTPIPLPK
jgi:hypothetical protein